MICGSTRVTHFDQLTKILTGYKIIGARSSGILWGFYHCKIPIQDHCSSFWVTVCLREEIFFIDVGPGTPRIYMQDKPTGVPIYRATKWTGWIERSQNSLIAI